MIIIVSIIDKVIEQGNNRNFDINVVNVIEEYMTNYLCQNHDLNYDLICRFILMENNSPLHNDEMCIKYLKEVNKKNITDKEYKAYFLILLANIEDRYSGVTDSTKEGLNALLLDCDSKNIKSMIYYMQANDFIFKDNTHAIQLLEKSIEEDVNAVRSYIGLSLIYRELGNNKLSQYFLIEGLKK